MTETERNIIDRYLGRNQSKKEDRDPVTQGESSGEKEGEDIDLNALVRQILTTPPEDGHVQTLDEIRVLIFQDLIALSRQISAQPSAEPEQKPQTGSLGSPSMNQESSEEKV
jgi:hypothetical protein